MTQDKEVQLNFNYGDGTTDTVSFLVPAGETGPQGPQGETGPAGDPASVCDSFTTLPVSDEFGDDPQIIVRSGGQCRVVNIPSKGIFTDIRSQAAWTGIALEGGTNTFVATARNVSVTNAGKVRVDIVLPTLPDDDIEYGTTTVSAPNGIVVTPIITTGANRSYYVENLNSGVNVSFNTPVTWNVKGTYQASVTVNAVDPNTVDYSSSDDYSVASYTVAPKSYGEGTIDCPLITGKIGTTDLAIGSAVTSSSMITQAEFVSKCLGIVLDGDRSFEVEFNRPVTIYPMRYVTIYGNYDVQQNSNGYGALSYETGSSSTGIVEITPLDGTSTKFKIKFVGGGTTSWYVDTHTLACFGVKAGANCNTQFFGVSADAGYRIGQTVTLTSDGATAPVYTKTSQFSYPTPNSHDIRHVDGTTHQLLVGASYQPLYKVEGLDMTLLEATAYDLTIAATIAPTTLPKTKLIAQTTTGTVTITYPNPAVNTVRFVASTNTSDHDSTTNGLLKYTFVQ